MNNKHFNEQQAELTNKKNRKCYNLAISNLPSIICSFIIESWKQKGVIVFILLFLQIHLAHLKAQLKMKITLLTSTFS